PAGRIALDDEDFAAFARGVRAVAEFSRQVQPGRRGALARDLGLSGPAGLARAGGEDDAGDDGFGEADVVVQPVFERGPDDAVDGRDQFGIVQPILGLALELRLLDEHAEDAGQALPDVLGDQRDPLRREVVRVDEVPDRLADAGPEPLLVRAARAGRDA